MGWRAAVLISMAVALPTSVRAETSKEMAVKRACAAIKARYGHDVVDCARLQVERSGPRWIVHEPFVTGTLGGGYIAWVAIRTGHVEGTGVIE